MRKDLGADAVGLDGLHDRPRACLARRAAGDQNGQLPDEVDLLLGQQPVDERPTALGNIERHPANQSATSSGAPTTRAPLPSYPPLGILTTTGQPTSSPKACNDGRIAHLRPARAGHPDLGEASTHRQLVLGEHERGRRRMQDDAVGLERSQDLSRHVLVVEGDDVALPGKGADPSTSVWSPTGEEGTTRAAEASADSARTDSVIDSPTEGGWHIRASWPPPMMPTTGNPPGARRGEVTSQEPIGVQPEPPRLRLRG